LPPSAHHFDRGMTDVQLRDHRLHPQVAQRDERVLDLPERHGVDLVVALQADGVHRDVPRAGRWTCRSGRAFILPGAAMAATDEAYWLDHYGRGAKGGSARNPVTYGHAYWFCCYPLAATGVILPPGRLGLCYTGPSAGVFISWLLPVGEGVWTGLRQARRGGF
jgi:hypothetical protein